METFEEAGHEFYTSSVNTTFFAYKIPGKFIDLLWIDKFLVNYG